MPRSVARRRSRDYRAWHAALALAAGGSLAVVPALTAVLLASASGYQRARHAGVGRLPSCFAFSTLPFYIGLAAAPLLAYRKLQTRSIAQIMPLAMRAPLPATTSASPRFGSAIAGGAACVGAGAVVERA